jgi:glycosyltransferase involved in cell wall biosynthesis
VTEKSKKFWNYTPLPEPIPITEQVWPEGTVPLVCTRTMTYNHENYIRDCIEGILMQKTAFPVRVCIHDDASTDKTAEIIREYQEKHPKLIWAYYQEENTYQINRKTGSYQGLRREFFGWSNEGKYVALCEGDDYWINSLKLERQINELIKNDLAIAVSNFSRVQINGKVYSERKTNYKVLNTKEILIDNGKSITTASLVFKTIALLNMPSFKSKAPVGDFPLKLFLSLHGKILMIDEFYNVYNYKNDGSWSSKKAEIIKDHNKKMTSFLKEFDNYTNAKYRSYINDNIEMRNIDTLLTLLKSQKHIKDAIKVFITNIDLVNLNTIYLCLKKIMK